VRLRGPEAAAHTLRFNLTVTDRDELWHIGIEHGTIHCLRSRHLDDADAHLRVRHNGLLEFAMGDADLDALLASGDVEIDGDETAVRTWLSLLDTFDSWFAIIEP
jgi:alkyl sulfatase BDS1-like metallo-beta-lactamase superfamily hydrolase